VILYFLDIGARRLYSLLAANNCSNIKVIAFEPVMKTFNLMKQNVLRNGFSKKIEAVNAGISYVDTEAVISILKNHSGAATLRKMIMLRVKMLKRLGLLLMSRLTRKFLSILT
jgi:FkbM family methyltransferase